MATVTWKLKIEDGGEIGGFTGVVKLAGKCWNVPLKTVWTQESRNTEPYAETCTYDSADELRVAAKRFVAMLIRTRRAA